MFIVIVLYLSPFLWCFLKSSVFWFLFIYLYAFFHVCYFQIFIFSIYDSIIIVFYFCKIFCYIRYFPSFFDVSFLFSAWIFFIAYLLSFCLIFFGNVHNVLFFVRLIWWSHVVIEWIFHCVVFVALIRSVRCNTSKHFHLGCWSLLFQLQCQSSNYSIRGLSTKSQWRLRSRLKCCDAVYAFFYTFYAVCSFWFF